MPSNLRIDPERLWSTLMETAAIGGTAKGGINRQTLTVEDAKVRAWFNLQAQKATIARGRESVEKLLQREGRTAVKLDDLAAQLGFRNADALFEVVGKDEYSLRNIENLLRPAFRQEEWKLIAVGGVIGFGVGELQVLLMLH